MVADATDNETVVAKATPQTAQMGRITQILAPRMSATADHENIF